MPPAAHAKAHAAAPAKPMAVAKKRLRRRSKRATYAPAAGIRTAYSATPQAEQGGPLSGAQPVVPAGSFESRWTALR